MLGDVLQNQYPNWTVGVSFGYPLGANTAHANLARVNLAGVRTGAGQELKQGTLATAGETYDSETKKIIADLKVLERRINDLAGGDELLSQKREAD